MVEFPRIMHEWIREKKDFRMVIVPEKGPFAIPPGEVVQIAGRPVKSLEGPEGVIFFGLAFFSSPLCGVRLELPYYDSGRGLRIDRLIEGGFTEPNGIVWADNPRPGLWSVAVAQHFEWRDWARIYVFNDDDVEQYCYYYTYWAAYLVESEVETL
ncbi:MAG: hypothetical protein JRD89_15215 [Deltaproteobacteria bacterium]|nr:hypothetical protein [Deltaproteobacteria bacterium]